MKAKVLISICLFVSCVCCQSSMSAQEPRPDKVYEAAQLDSLFFDFFKMDGRDINYPEKNILQKFQSQFSGASDIEWETRNNLYSVDFEIGKVDYMALYDQQANLLLYKFDIPRSAIPAAVKKAYAPQYGGIFWRIEDAEKIVTAHGTIYKIEFEKGKQEAEVYYNADGSVVKNYINF